MDNEKMVAYLAFQGGGAKGISHVGGLAAVSEMNLEIGGVAGTSAGALIAALVAVGYSAKEMFDVDSGDDRDHILKRLSDGKYANPTSLFTPHGWRSLQKLISVTRRVASIWGWLTAARWRQSVFVVLGGILVLCSFFVIGYFLPKVELALLFVGLVLTAPLLVKVYGVYLGLCELSTVREVVDEALRRKLGAADQDITFGRLKAEGALPLKLVATNVTNGCLELFSYETTPEVVVADAVCASVCIPFVFKRWSFMFRRQDEDIEVERQFVDGGLMSNLPSWSFDEERALNSKALTIAFGLKSKDAIEGRPIWLMSALNAVVAGPPQIHLRGINRLIHIPIESPLELLDFDKSYDDFQCAILDAKKQALLKIIIEVTEIPNEIRQLLTELRDIVEEMFFKKYGEKRQGTSRLFRVALAIQRPNSFLSLTVAYQIGEYADGTVPALSIERSRVGMAWCQRELQEPALEIFDLDVKSSDKVFMDSAWMLPIPVTISKPTADEARSSKLAVVLIIDSPRPLGAVAQSDDALKEFSSFLYENVLEYCSERDLGKSVRRSVSWL